MTRKSTLQYLIALIPLACAIAAHAGDIFFSAEASLSASRDDVSGVLDIRLQSSEWIYNPVVYVRGEGERKEIARYDTWAQNEVKHIEFTLPSPHRLAGDYDLLAEIHFQDMGGALLSANLAVHYQVRDQALLTGMPEVSVDSTRLNWDLKEYSNASTSLYAPPPPFLTAPGNIVSAGDTALAWQANPKYRARPNWRYPLSARLDFVENGVHGSRVLHWNIVTDQTGAMNPSPTPQQAAAAQALPVEFSAQATLTAAPTLMEGTAQLRFNQYGPLRNVVVTTTDAADQPVTLGSRGEWAPDSPLDLSFKFALNHALPGGYFFFMTVAFDDAEGFRHHAPLTLEYTVDRAVTPVAPPTVQLNQRQFVWQTGGADPATIELQITTSPAWAPLERTLGPTDTELHLTALENARTAPNWRYPQLARLTWVADNARFSVISEWVILTDSRGQWAPATAQAADTGQAGDVPWWRRQGVLLFAAILLIGFAVIFSVMKKPG